MSRIWHDFLWAFDGDESPPTHPTFALGITNLLPVLLIISSAVRRARVKELRAQINNSI
jgi:hypothetical protein